MAYLHSELPVGMSSQDESHFGTRLPHLSQ